MPELKTRVRHYAEHLDELAPPVTFDELIVREVEPVTMPEVERRVLATRRRVWVAAAAAVLVLVLIGGAALLLGTLGTEPDLIDEPTTTTAVNTTVTQAAESAGLSINNLATGSDIFPPRVGLDPSGNPVVVYHEGYDTLRIEIVHCADPACADSAASSSIEVEGEEINVFTAFTPDGSPIVIVSAIDEDAELLRCADPACSSYSTTLLGRQMRIGSTTVNPAGNPAMIVYVGGEDTVTQLVTCLDPACAERTAGNLNLPRPSVSTRMTYGQDGYPLVVSVGRDLEREVSSIDVLHCGDLTCSTGGTMSHPLDAGLDEGNLGIMIGSDGNPVIAFGDRQLQVVTCNDPSCTSAGPAVNVGQRMIIEGEGLSLHEGSDGNPLIAFTAARTGDEPQQPMLAVCTDQECTTGTIGLVDTAPSIWSAGAATPDGTLSLAYGNWAELSMASCRGAGCTDGLLDPATWDQTPVTPTTAPPLGDVIEGWVRVPHDPAVFGPGDGGFYTVVEAGPGLIATGDTCELVDGNSVCKAGIWVSTDATEWDQVASTATGPGGSPVTVAEDPNGLVAVGGMCPEDGGPCEARVWTSDDGFTWTSIPVSRDVFGCPGEPDCDFRLEGITAGGPGFVTWGSGFGGHWIWTSVDGSDWQLSDMDGSGTMINDIVKLGDLLVAVGTTYTDIYNEAGEWVNFTEDLAVLTSEDGSSWSRVTSQGFEGASALRTAVWARGITLTGTVCDENWNCTDQVWNSPNGLSWTRSPLNLGIEQGGMYSMVAGGPGLIASGSVSDRLEERETALFWTSTDGLAWELHESDPAVFPEGGGINAFAWLGGRLIGVGSSGVDKAPAVWIWTP